MAKKSKKRKSAPAPFDSQAAAEALIRYNPELTGLKELQQQATDTYGARVHSGNATSAALQSTIDAAIPGVRGAYDEGAAGLDQIKALVSGDTAGLQGAGAERFRNALTSEGANFSAMLGGARADALGELGRRRVSAAEGAKFSADQAGSDLASSLEKIGLRRTELAKESGAFQQQRVGELTAEQRKRQFDARENRRDRTSRSNIASKDRTSAEKRNSADNATSRGNALIGQGIKVDASGNPVLDSKGRPVKLPGAKKSKSAFTNEQRRAASRTIRSGVESLDAKYQLPKEPSKSNALAAVYLLTEKEGVKDTFLAQVAVSRYLYGGVTSDQQKRLRRQYGISVKALDPAADAIRSVQPLLPGGR
jgi:hypothetical protein